MLSGGRIKFKHESASVQLVPLEKDLYAVSNLYSQHRGYGHARRVMEMAIEFADRERLILKLIAQRYGYSDKRSMDNPHLVRFYETLGFVQDPGSVRLISMTRYPSREIHAS